MSTVLGPTRAGAARQPVRSTRPRLRVVDDAPFRPPRMPFVLFVVALLVAGLVGLLLLNTGLQQGTFRVTDLNKQAQQLQDQQQALEHQVRTLEAPQHLADRALELGMVPNPNPVFLRLPDGKVLGVPAKGQAGSGATAFGPLLPKPTPKPVVKPPAVTPSALPSVQPSAQPSAPPTAQQSKPPARPVKPARAPTPTPTPQTGG
jgi:cell division protein FtsB